MAGLINACPGALHLKQPTLSYVTCSRCGADDVEIWSDETMARCHHCGTPVFREKIPSCIDWCSAARECLGDDLYERLKSSRID